MTDMTSAVQDPGLVGVVPTYTQCTATDKFAASPDARYLLHYKNGATPTGALKVVDQTTVIPPGSTAVAGFADAQMSASMGGTTELIVTIDNSSRFRDAQGFINLTHGTPTTVSLAIVGPL